LIMSGAVMVMVVVVMMHTVVDVLWAAMCCVGCYCPLSSTRYIFRRLSAFLSSDFVSRLCPQNVSSTFIEPSAKTTRARVLVINERSRARLNPSCLIDTNTVYSKHMMCTIAFFLRNFITRKKQ
jgi:hypothetical protein